MKYSMKQFEAWSGEHCKLLKKNWELYCNSSYAYVNGYKKFRESLIEELKKKYEPHTGDYFVSIDHMIELLEKHGENVVEVEIEHHQLGTPHFSPNNKGPDVE